MLKVGIAEVDITPAPGLAREGMPFPQKGQGTAWPLMGRLFVFDDGSRKAAVVVLDLLFLHPLTVAEYRQAMTAGTDLAPEDVMVACTHTHWAPHTTSLMDEETSYPYLDFVRQRLVEGMRIALQALCPARLKVGRSAAPGWAFNRRQVYNTPLGEQVGTQGPQWIPEFVRMEGPDDPELGVLWVEGEGGKPMGGLVNFACHTTIGPDEPLYSADFPGPLTEQLAGDLGGVYGFLQGCAGNIWGVDLSHPQDPAKPQNGTAHTRRMGEALALKARQGLAGAKMAGGERVRVARRVLQIPQRQPSREQVEQARWFLEKRTADADLRQHHLACCGHEFTFYRDWSQASDPETLKWMLWQEEWFARGLIGLWEAQRRSGRRQVVEDVEVQAIAIGDVAMVGYPAEYFVEFGLRTKAESPFAATLVAELANGWHGYVGTQEAFKHGGYETRLGDASWLVPEAGDLICDTGIALLKELWDGRG